MRAVLFALAIAVPGAIPKADVDAMWVVQQEANGLIRDIGAAGEGLKIRALSDDRAFKDYECLSKVLDTVASVHSEVNSLALLVSVSSMMQVKIDADSANVAVGVQQKTVSGVLTISRSALNRTLGMCPASAITERYVQSGLSLVDRANTVSDNIRSHIEQ